LLQLIESLQNRLVRGEKLAQPHKGPHDYDIHVDGSVTVKDSGKHGHPLLGKGIREGPPATSPRLDLANCDVKDRVSFFVSWNIKSCGKRVRFLLTCSLSRPALADSCSAKLSQGKTIAGAGLARGSMLVL
jgi:hypothetical protein